ncbi:hypothetical protein BKA83DRAFT_4218619 [Pisolithus microcarpus]|nr:hypothetical protein BKA83DRAFT_4218619 [Pisolithus microcarpus]
MTCRARRRAAWLAFGLVALAAFSASANPDDPQPTQGVRASTAQFSTPDSTIHGQQTTTPPHDIQPDVDHTTEGSVRGQASLGNIDFPAPAARAFRSAIFTLHNLTDYSQQYAHDPFSQPSASQQSSFLSSLLPTAQGKGPIGSAIRISQKLYHRIFSSGKFSTSRKKDEEIQRKAIKVIDLLQLSAELGNMDALFALAHLSLFPPNIYFPLDPKLAYSSFATHASATGNATSQSYLAFFHSTGYADVVPIDQTKALLYYTFAAQGGDKGAQMALGYPMQKFLSGPPGGLTLPYTPTSLSDLDGASQSTGFNVIRPAVKAGFARAAGETWEDLLEYYMGKWTSQYKLGKIFYQGSIYAAAGGTASGSEGVGRIAQDFKQAQYYFLQIARQVWPRDPPNPLQHKASAYKAEAVPQPGWAPKSAAYIGRMYMRGEGSEYADRECHNGLGIIWRDGLALEHFAIAAGQELAEAHVNLGKHYYARGEFRLAATYFETAIRFGSTFEAHFYLAKIHTTNMRASGLPQDYAAGSCSSAVSFYKLAAERGVWDDDLELAILKWWVAAERGLEVAQNNLAYVLDQDKSMLRFTRFSPNQVSNDTARLALTQWIRSAAQRNVDSLVKVGDYYYHGFGVPDEPESVRWEKAAKFYQSAADTQFSALAMWNLGWMYENGIGVPQDFHLAKRHYDQALEVNSEAYLPVLLSLVKLHARSLWHTLQGGENGLKLWGYDEDSMSVSERANLKREIDPASRSQPNSETRSHAHEETVDTFDDDGPWYMGKAREDFQRRREQTTQEDPVQWARERRNAENERDGDFGPEDYFDAALLWTAYLETMLLVTLCFVVAVLIYVRTRLVQRARREEEQDQGRPPPNLGLFPPPGDPARQDWQIVR